MALLKSSDTLLPEDLRYMLSSVIEEIDKEIARLRQAKELLSSLDGGKSTAKKGRKRRVLSEDALERIREGQRKRWAKVRPRKV
jgi:hypothetical protein